MNTETTPPRCAFEGCTNQPAFCDAKRVYRCANKAHWPLRLRALWAWSKLTQFRLRVSWDPEFDHFGWFNIGAPVVLFYTPFFTRGIYVRLWNAFRRKCANSEEHGGAGILQIGSRHLLYTGFTDDECGEPAWRMCVAFLWLVGQKP